MDLIDADTIVAISTPPGRGGIGIVRLSGPQAKAIAEPILRLTQPLHHATARFASIVDQGLKLDEAVVTYFGRPHSYTSEDVVEIAAHGSPVVLEFLVRHALAHGARLARPGEFTERAFLSGRIDLTQAEAVRDLIEAQTLVQARLAAEQMGGALSRRIAPVKELLVSLIATLEAGVDFAEDDIDVMPFAEILNRIAAIQIALTPIAASYSAGRLIHDGLSLAIVGPPNAGKSSLFNRLLERERAIVTPIAGTTRDLITERLALGGIPVELVDTAGLRETTDQAELMGIEKTREAMADADVVLLIFDGSEIAKTGKEALRAWTTTLLDQRTVVVIHKVDLLPHDDVGIVEEAVSAVLRDNPAGSSADALPIAKVSSLTGFGTNELREQIIGRVRGGGEHAQSGMLTTVRHHAAIMQCQEALTAAHATADAAMPHEMVLLDLYAALQGLDSLTGATTADDILNRIFSTFCIGK